VKGTEAMDERDLTPTIDDLAWYERADLCHAYHRARIEMRETRAKVTRTGKTPCYFLEDDDDWTPVPMDDAFWIIVTGGLNGLRRLLRVEDDRRAI